jgi:cysteinyl-tRNA synthetase
MECTAMIDAIERYFPTNYTVMIHAGEIDLQFPHHTNEIAQAEAYHYTPTSL